MKLKLQLLRDDEVILEMPLSCSDWSREKLVDELDSVEEHFGQISKIFTALSSQTRLLMMKRLMAERDHTISFSDFMQDLDLNPKIVWENTRKLKNGGLLEKTGRGQYRCSQFGETSFIMISFMLRHLAEALAEMEDY